MAGGVKDRIAPHNEDAERAVLGGLMLDEDAIATAIAYLRPADFYSNANRRVCEAIFNLYNRGIKADILTVVEELRTAGELDAAGGEAYVASLTTVVPTIANSEYYAQIVQDGSVRRSLIRIAGKTASEAYDESRNSRLILEEAQQHLFDLTDARQTLSYRSVKEIIPKTIDILEKLKGSGREYTGIPSGFDELDRMTSGFQAAELIIIGARPSVGKTALALSMAANITLARNSLGQKMERRIPAAFFTLEMPDQALMMRLLAAEAGVSSNALRTGYYTASDLHKLVDAAGRLYEAPLFLVDMPNLKLLDLRAQARRLRAQEKVEIIFIDYLTLISSENSQLPRHEQVAEISRSLKSLARELNIPIVALSQISRDVEKRNSSGSARPVLADLRESGSIEQDADLVLFLHRDRKAEKNEAGHSAPGETDIPTDLIVAKQRNGPTGQVQILFRSRYAHYVSMEKSAPP
ncbi:MAG: replicative DNA helicase [Spirochaetaceae bacterium]|jgi:replicative DNA helicase|nr:replicative DNA helicase [Spirochaetaceae bacterium]